MRASFFIFCLFYFYNVNAAPRCMGDMSAATVDLSDLSEVVSKVNERSMNELVSDMCLNVCFNNQELFHQTVATMIETLSLKSEEEFYRDHFKQIRCPSGLFTNQEKNCVHENESVLRTLLGDMNDRFMFALIREKKIDITKPDPTDGLTLYEWTKKQCEDTKAGPLSREFFCSKMPVVKCQVMRQLPPEQRNDVPAGCKI